ncbi:MAG: hypothetical protein ACK4IX_12630 [Candidatus Sericytochromatia bacterium]
MSKKEQKEFEAFKINLTETISQEESKLKLLSKASPLLNNKQFDNHLKKRKDFLAFCISCLNAIKNITEYTTIDPKIEKYRKDYSITIDFMRKESLIMISNNQNAWFKKFFESDFKMLKDLIKSSLITENPYDVATMERIMQEVELLRYK